MEIVLNQTNLGVGIFIVLTKGIFLALGNYAGHKQRNSHPRLVFEKSVGASARIGHTLEHAQVHTVVRFIGLGLFGFGQQGQLGRRSHVVTFHRVHDNLHRAIYTCFQFTVLGLQGQCATHGKQGQETYGHKTFHHVQVMC